MEDQPTASTSVLSIPSDIHIPISTLQLPALLEALPSRTKRTAPQLLSDQLGPEIVTAEFGGRVIQPEEDIWKHNAWDQVEWGEEQESIALKAIERQSLAPVTDAAAEIINGNAASHWDTFYSAVKDGFFNDRAWLLTEFPELASALQPDAGPKSILEIGCGTGATLYPLLKDNRNPTLKMVGLDFSEEAVGLVKSNPNFDPTILSSQTWDLSTPNGIPKDIEEGSVDIVIMIFVLSALHPDEWERARENVWRFLKPGGILLFRDYGRHDMTQLRFKTNRLLQPGLYCRGDKTRVYFFERDELIQIFSPADPSLFTPSSAPPPNPDSQDPLSLSSLSLDKASPTDVSTTPTKYGLDLVQLGVDRRLLLNRKKQLKMYRVWMQGRWRKSVFLE